MLPNAAGNREISMKTFGTNLDMNEFRSDGTVYCLTATSAGMENSLPLNEK